MAIDGQKGGKNMFGSRLIVLLPLTAGACLWCASAPEAQTLAGKTLQGGSDATKGSVGCNENARGRDGCFVVVQIVVAQDGRTAIFKLGRSEAAYEAFAQGLPYNVRWEKTSTGEIKASEGKISFSIDSQRSYELIQDPANPRKYGGRQIYESYLNGMMHDVYNPAVFALSVK
jgi:hypothetical protein